jgi:hypothetical protein
MQRTEIFFSYAHEDTDLMHDVRRQLIVYDRLKMIEKWYDKDILPGRAWAGEIDEHLRQAPIILLLVSPHFIESKYCYDVEMAEALRRHKDGQAVVILIILRPCPWQDLPIGYLKALPENGKAITLWNNRDEACLDIAQGIMRVVRGVSNQNAIPVEAAHLETSRPSWPNNQGVYISTSSENIPHFPRALSGYRAAGDKDYWDRPFAINGSIRIGEGNGWEPIPDFPLTMNHCSDGVFMIRWRSANPDVLVATAIGYHYSGEIYATETGTFGFMQGTNCEEPMFKFAGTLNGNQSNLVDVYYELKFWQAAP